MQKRDADTHRRDPSPSDTTFPPRPFILPKNRSSSTLSDYSRSNPAPAIRHSSLDAGSMLEPSTAARSPIFSDLEESYAPSGLGRIRRQPNTNVLARSASMIISIPHASTGGTTTSPSSPLLTAGDDLMRFPSESLHSYSFAQKSDDFLQMRYNVLRRSIDLLRDKGLFAAGGFGAAHAHAKLTGDEEARGIIDLLSKANLIPDGGAQKDGSGISLGPMTGPAHTFGDNPFEKDFTRSESPEPLERAASVTSQKEEEEMEFGSLSRSPPVVTLRRASRPTSYSSDNLAGMPSLNAANAFNPRSSLRRTYTDIATHSLQKKLTEALSQPYLASDNSMLSPLVRVQSANIPSNSQTGSNNHAHTRGAKGMPPSQAIFTTEACSPYTITAANDLACLAFRVQRSEIRQLGILDVVREDKRKWLESKLARPPVTPRTPSPRPDGKASPSPVRASSMGKGVTARLLSKPPSTYQSKRTRSADGSGSNSTGNGTPKSAPSHTQSRGVLLCGDVIPILKRNGDVGSASVWVQEKRDKLIWVLEEIAEDVAFLTVDEVGCVVRVSGQVDAIWGMERVRRGMDLTRLIPDVPRLQNTNTGALDLDEIANLRRFTARTANDISVPITVDQLSGQLAFRISSFPHMAGMLLVSAATLKISGSNGALSEALFGQNPNGLSMNALIPGFDKMLELLSEEDDVNLVEGMVIPEQSFRHARAMLALREGKVDAAAVFLRPNGVPAIHRDGAEIMVDVQMRVVKSSTFGESISDQAIPEQHVEGESTIGNGSFGPSSLIYALWVTYSRSLHAVNHGVGPVPSIISRPGTPPQQLSPGQAIPVHTDDSESDDGSRMTPRSSTTSISSSGIHLKPRGPATAVSTERATATGLLLPRERPAFKRSISDFSILEDMGAGAYGQVKLARPRGNSGDKVVIKYVTKRRILVDTWTRDRRLGTVPLEIHVLDYLRRDGHKHPNIVEMLDFFEDDVNYYIVMKPHGLPGMDLFDYIELRVNMSEDECRRIFRQVVSAVEFLHIKAKVVHRDIKDENVILDGEGKIKLIDFGSASYIKNGPFDVFVGTIDYAAPEVLSGQPYAGLPQDIWALGILFYTILYKENPFYNTDEIMDHDLRIPYSISEDSLNLLRGLLDRDVDKRLTIEQVVAHPFFKDGDGEEQDVVATGVDI